MLQGADALSKVEPKSLPTLLAATLGVAVIEAAARLPEAAVEDFRRVSGVVFVERDSLGGSSLFQPAQRCIVPGAHQRPTWRPQSLATEPGWPTSTRCQSWSVGLKQRPGRRLQQPVRWVPNLCHFLAPRVHLGLSSVPAAVTGHGEREQKISRSTAVLPGRPGGHIPPGPAPRPRRALRANTDSERRGRRRPQHVDRGSHRR